MDYLSYIIQFITQCVGLLISVPIVLIHYVMHFFVKKPSLVEYRTILITGASSGICREMAIQMAGEGIHLILMGRNSERLAETARIAESLKSTVSCGLVDTTHAEEMKQFIENQDRLTPIDLVIAGVAVSSGSSPSPGDSSQSLNSSMESTYRFLLDTNIRSLVNTVLPIVEPMRQRNRGRICVISSISGMGVNPMYPMLSTTKCFTSAFAESIRYLLAGSDVGVSIVQPSFTRTRMLPDDDDATHWIPKLSASCVAKLAVQGLYQGNDCIECNVWHNAMYRLFLHDIPMLPKTILAQTSIPLLKKLHLYVHECPITKE